MGNLLINPQMGFWPATDKMNLTSYALYYIGCKNVAVGKIEAMFVSKLIDC